MRLFLLLLAFLSPGALANENPTAPSAGPDVAHEFFFTRGIYSGDFESWDEGGRWAVDFPKADQQFLIALKRLSLVNASGDENSI